MFLFLKIEEKDQRHGFEKRLEYLPHTPNPYETLAIISQL